MSPIQTFLPWPDYWKSAQCLDRQRLGKQRVENLQILSILTGYKTVPLGESYEVVKAPATGGWVNHPAVRMWRGHTRSLLRYQQNCVTSWLNRNYADTCWSKSVDLVQAWDPYYTEELDREPDWLGYDYLHLSHRRNLLRKFPEHYGPLFEPGLTPTTGYVWPV